MAKRPHGRSTGKPQGAGGGTPAHLLTRLRVAWREGDWEGARLVYNTWTNRTGRKRDDRLDEEMLFRAASAAFRRGTYDRALSSLDDLLARRPVDGRRYAVCKAHCLAWKGRLRESGELFASSGDDYHASIVEHILTGGMRLPPRPNPGDPAFEPSQLLSFWRNLADPAAPDPTSTALRSVRRAYHALLRGEEPDAHLGSLRTKPGCERLAVALMLVAAVALRRGIRVRNIISKYPEHCRDDWSLSILDSHLVLLLREREYREIETLEGILEGNGLRPSGLELSRDERLFAEGLREVGAQRWEEARVCFRAIRGRTPSVSHNLALVCQKTERFAEANQHWIALLQKEKRPKRSDPEEKRLAYAAAAKAIATNYVTEGLPSKALPFLKNAHALSERDPEILESLAQVCLDLDADAEALNYARKLHELAPEDEHALVGYVMALRRNHRADLLVSLFDARWERIAGNPILASVLSGVYAEVAWEIRAADPAKAREIADKARAIAPDNPFLIYLEGYFLSARGRREEAAERFGRAIEETESHATQVLLGMALYDEGYRDQSLDAFKKIVECGCNESLDALYDIVDHLAQRDDRVAVDVCSHAVDAGGVELYFAADSLLEADKPLWAKEFSSRLVQDPAADEDDRFLHELILEASGESAGSRDSAARGPEEVLMKMIEDMAKLLDPKGKGRSRHD